MTTLPISPARSLLVAALLSTAVFLLPARSASALDKVALDVQVRTDGAAMEKGKTETDQRFLDIKVTNRTTENLSGLTVKWAIFARDLGKDDTSKAGSGEVKSSIGPMRAEQVQGQTVTMKYTPAHAQKGKGGKGGGKGSAKTVKASGERLAGWGVQVFQDGNMVGEAYSRFELKKEM